MDNKKDKNDSEQMKKALDLYKIMKECNIDIDDIENCGIEKARLLSKIGDAINSNNKKVIISDMDSDFKKDRRPFVKMYIDNLDVVINNLNSATEIKILYFLIKNINRETGLINIPQIEISETLKIAKPVVSKAIKSLVIQGYIIEDESTINRRQKSYLLNPKYFRYGRIE